MKLKKEFYQRNVHQVVKELLGKIFVRRVEDKLLSGKIVEIEAYDGSVDESAHSFIGKTKRNEVMFRDGGLLYVYFTYGMHFCANIVTGKENEGCAILLRAIEPIAGTELMSMNRYSQSKLNDKQIINLTNGPAKICQAFQLGRNENGVSLSSGEIYIKDAPVIPQNKIVSTIRIGIKKSVDLPWRYYIKDNPYVSRHPNLRDSK